MTTKQELATFSGALGTLATLTKRFKEDLGAWSTANMLAYKGRNLRRPLTQNDAESQHMAVYSALFEALDVPLPASEEHRQAYSYALHSRIFDVRIFLLRALGEFPEDKPLSPEERLAVLRHSIERPPPVWYLAADYDSDEYDDDQPVYVADHTTAQNGATA